MCLLPDSTHGRRDVTLWLGGLTDNKGNAHVLDKHMTSKFPLVVLLMELAAQCEAKGIRLELLWTPRLQNEDADALTNSNFSAFDPKRRVEIDLAKLPFRCLPAYMEAGLELYAQLDVIKQRAAQVPAAPQQVRKRKRLKDRDPWWEADFFGGGLLDSLCARKSNEGFSDVARLQKQVIALHIYGLGGCPPLTPRAVQHIAG
jgi:hypothetical protein